MKKLVYLDSVRGIACLMVVMSHLSLTFFPYLHNTGDGHIPKEYFIQNLIHNSLFGFFYSGTAAVYVFFVLSGIVLTKSMDNKNISGYLDSIVSRYPRLMLPALVSCFISYITYKFIIINPPSSNVLTAWFHSLYIQTPTIVDAIYHGTIKPFFLEGSSYNSVLWTMKIELLGSFMIYAFSYISIKNKVFSSILFLVLSLLTVLISRELAIGFLCFWFGFNIYKFNFVFKNQTFSLVLFFLGLYFAGAHNTSESYYFIYMLFGDYTYSLSNIIAGFLIVVSVMSNDKIKRILSNKMLARLGELSFPIYLIHIFVMSISVYFLYGRMTFITNADIKNLVLCFIIISLSIFLSRFMLKVDELSVSFSKRLKIVKFTEKL